MMYHDKVLMKYHQPQQQHQRKITAGTAQIAPKFLIRDIKRKQHDYHCRDAEKEKDVTETTAHTTEIQRVDNMVRLNDSWRTII